VVLNQIILRFGDDTDSAERRKTLATAVMDCLIADGMIFVAGAAWRGEWVMRISVISGAISDADVAITTDAIRAAWTKVLATKLSETAAR
jgi:biotin transporter BioY